MWNFQHHETQAAPLDKICNKTIPFRIPTFSRRSYSALFKQLSCLSCKWHRCHASEVYPTPVISSALQSVAKPQRKNTMVKWGSMIKNFAPFVWGTLKETPLTGHNHDAGSQHRKPELSITPLWKPQNWKLILIPLREHPTIDCSVVAKVHEARNIKF